MGAKVVEDERHLFGRDAFAHAGEQLYGRELLLRRNVTRQLFDDGERWVSALGFVRYGNHGGDIGYAQNRVFGIVVSRMESVSHWRSRLETPGTFFRIDHCLVAAWLPIADEVGNAGTKHQQKAFEAVLWLFRRSANEQALRRVELADVFSILPFDIQLCALAASVVEMDWVDHGTPFSSH